MQRGGRRIHKGQRQSQIGVRDCSLLESSGNILWDRDLCARDLIPKRSKRSRKGHKEKLDYVAVTVKASTDIMGSSRNEKAFRNCPELRQGGQLWYPCINVIGCRYWFTWGSRQELEPGGFSSPKGKLWRETQLSAVNNVKLSPQLGKVSSSVLQGGG